ncbi:hypothetical protein GTX53_27950 [Streptomyces sp. SID5594]|uniref:hypothetical protein n=1 Tax=Streptomyces TaxID=1883 RepID=UPI001319E496|nr:MULTISPECIES: hypothetical protein [unclassified Streptomyces]MZF57619.1 hypothetical protein [Streptomyces sp. SID5594]
MNVSSGGSVGQSAEAPQEGLCLLLGLLGRPGPLGRSSDDVREVVQMASMPRGGQPSSGVHVEELERSCE